MEGRLLLSVESGLGQRHIQHKRCQLQNGMGGYLLVRLSWCVDIYVAVKYRKASLPVLIYAGLSNPIGLSSLWTSDIAITVSSRSLLWARLKHTKHVLFLRCRLMQLTKGAHHHRHHYG